jgi:hypothetical protein
MKGGVCRQVSLIKSRITFIHNPAWLHRHYPVAETRCRLNKLRAQSNSAESMPCPEPFQIRVSIWNILTLNVCLSAIWLRHIARKYVRLPSSRLSATFHDINNIKKTRISRQKTITNQLKLIDQRRKTRRNVIRIRESAPDPVCRTRVVP